MDPEKRCRPRDDNFDCLKRIGSLCRPWLARSAPGRGCEVCAHHGPSRPGRGELSQIWDNLPVGGIAGKTDSVTDCAKVIPVGKLRAMITLSVPAAPAAAIVSPSRVSVTSSSDAISGKVRVADNFGCGHLSVLLRFVFDREPIIAYYGSLVNPPY